MLLSQVPNTAGYVNGTPRVSPKTLLLYSTSIERLIEHVGDRPLDEVEPEHVHAWHEWMKGSDLAVATANTYRRTVAAMLRRVGRVDLAQVLKQQPQGPRKSKAISEEDFKKLIAYANTRDAAMLLLMRDSGCRRGAIPFIRKSKMKLWQGPDGRNRFAARVKTKGDHEQVIFAGHTAATAVALWLDIQPFADQVDHVFTCLDRPEFLKPDSINSIFRTLKKRAGIKGRKNVHPHALRHRFAHDKLGEFDAKIVSQLLGHSDVRTTLEIYGHRTQDELEKAYFGD